MFDAKQWDTFAQDMCSYISNDRGFRLVEIRCDHAHDEMGEESGAAVVRERTSVVDGLRQCHDSAAT